MDKSKLRDSINMGHTIRRELGRLRRLASERNHPDWVEEIGRWERATDEHLSQLTIRDYGASD